MTERAWTLLITRPTVGPGSRSTVWFAFAAFVHQRLRREPPLAGDEDVLRSLQHDVAREEWNLAQLRVGRGVTLLTLFAIGIMTADHLGHASTTPPGRLATLLGVARFVALNLGVNLRMTRQAETRRSRLEHFRRQLGDITPAGTAFSRRRA